MLTVSDLKVNYGSATALRGVNLEVKPGEIVAVIGRNGAGKTTLLRAITGLTAAAGGRVEYKGAPIQGLPAHRIMRMGIAHVPQGRQVFGDQSVEDNLLLGAYSQYFKDRTAVGARMEAQYKLFPRLAERRRQQAGTLSGGEQQMLAIARALMSDPDLLAMDEPSMGLAPIFVRQVLDTVLELKARGKTVLLVEQLATAALAVADRAYVLQVGEVKLTGPARELLKEEAVLKSYLGG